MSGASCASSASGVRAREARAGLDRYAPLVPADAARKRATYEDVLAAPAGKVAELLFGVLHLHPRRANLLEVLVLRGARYEIFATHRDDASVSAPPFDAIAIDLGGLWADFGPSHER